MAEFKGNGHGDGDVDKVEPGDNVDLDADTEEEEEEEEEGVEEDGGEEEQEQSTNCLQAFVQSLTGEAAELYRSSDTLKRKLARSYEEDPESFLNYVKRGNLCPACMRQNTNHKQKGFFCAHCYNYYGPKWEKDRERKAFIRREAKKAKEAAIDKEHLYRLKIGKEQQYAVQRRNLIEVDYLEQQIQDLDLKNEDLRQRFESGISRIYNRLSGPTVPRITASEVLMIAPATTVPLFRQVPMLSPSKPVMRIEATPSPKQKKIKIESSPPQVTSPSPPDSPPKNNNNNPSALTPQSSASRDSAPNRPPAVCLPPPTGSGGVVPKEQTPNNPRQPLRPIQVQADQPKIVPWPPATKEHLKPPANDNAPPKAQAQAAPQVKTTAAPLVNTTAAPLVNTAATPQVQATATPQAQSSAKAQSSAQPLAQAPAQTQPSAKPLAQAQTQAKQVVSASQPPPSTPMNKGKRELDKGASREKDKGTMICYACEDWIAEDSAVVCCNGCGYEFHRECYKFGKCPECAKSDPPRSMDVDSFYCGTCKTEIKGSKNLIKDSKGAPVCRKCKAKPAPASSPHQ